MLANAIRVIAILRGVADVKEVGLKPEFLALNFVPLDGHGCRLDIGTVQDAVASVLNQAPSDFAREWDDVSAFAEDREIIVIFKSRSPKRLCRLNRSEFIFEHVFDRVCHLSGLTDVDLGAIVVPHGLRRQRALTIAFPFIKSRLLGGEEVLGLL